MVPLGQEQRVPTAPSWRESQNFGAFLAPHHPIGEHPMLQFRRDLDLVEHLDKLGYDEFWCGEHHSSGWEMIGSPEMFLAAAGERTKRIKLATGVVSLPYHHPFNVAQRMVQLDYMTGGRAIFGSGPGALASDAHTLGIDPMLLRDRQDEAIGVIRRLFRGERVTAKSDWFTLQDAALQLLPLQEEMPFAVASQISPSGMTLAGKHGIGIISIGSLSEEGLNALPTQWGFAEAAAAKHGQTIDRKNWRVLLSWHIAETREKARAEARDGLFRHHNEYITGDPAAARAPSPSRIPTKRWTRRPSCPAPSPRSARRTISSSGSSRCSTISGGFGTVVGFVHDWANPENTMRSWDMVARYVVPEINGYLAGLRKSREFVATNREYFDRARRGGDGEDHREPGRGRGAQGHEVAAAGCLGRQPARSGPGPRRPRFPVSYLSVADHPLETPMTDKIRVGIVGATVTQGGSGWGANAHVPALKALPGYELAAVCTAHENTAKASAAAFGVERAFHRFSDMAAASGGRSDRGLRAGARPPRAGHGRPAGRQGRVLRVAAGCDARRSARDGRARPSTLVEDHRRPAGAQRPGDSVCA